MFLYSPTRQRESWQPAVDVYRSQNGWILKFDLAGVRMEDVQVRVGKRAVSVSGVRRDWFRGENGCCHYSMEITYNRFARTIDLPEELNTSNFRLDYRDGILFVRIPEREEDSDE